MIDIQLESGITLYLSQKTRIAIKRQSSLFDGNFIALDASFEFSLPIKGNEKALNFQHIPNTHISTFEYNARLLVGGNIRFIGTLKLTTSDNTFFNAKFVSDLDGSIKISTLFPKSIEGATASDSSAVNTAGYPQYHYCWPSYINDDAELSNKYIHKYVNRHDATGFTVTVGGLKVPLSVHLYLVYVLKTVCNAIGYSAEGSLFSHPEFIKMFVWNNYIFEWNGGNYVVPEKHLVPNITIDQLFRETKKRCGLRITVDSVNRSIHFDLLNSLDKTTNVLNLSVENVLQFRQRFPLYTGLDISIDFIDSYNSSAVKDYSQIEIYQTVTLSSDIVTRSPQPDQYWFCTADNAIYYVDDSVNPTFFCYASQKVITEKGNSNLTAESSTLTEYLDVTDVEQQLLPRINHPISDKQLNNEFDLYLLFFRGYQRTQVSANTYPLASSHVYALTDIFPYYIQVGDLSTHPNGEFGTYNTLYKEHDKWVKSLRLYSLQFKLSIDQLDKLSSRSIISINGTHYYVLEFTEQYSTDGMLLVKAELAKAHTTI